MSIISITCPFGMGMCCEYETKKVCTYFFVNYLYIRAQILIFLMLHEWRYMSFIKRRVHGKAIKVMVVAGGGVHPHLLGHERDPKPLQNGRSGCDLFASTVGRTYVWHQIFKPGRNIDPLPLLLLDTFQCNKTFLFFSTINI